MRNYKKFQIKMRDILDAEEKAQKVSGAAMAEAIGISVQAYYNLKKYNNCNVQTLAKVADFFPYPLEVLFYAVVTQEPMPVRKPPVPRRRINREQIAQHVRDAFLIEDN